MHSSYAPPSRKDKQRQLLSGLKHHFAALKGFTEQLIRLTKIAESEVKLLEEAFHLDPTAEIVLDATPKIVANLPESDTTVLPERRPKRIKNAGRRLRGSA